MIDSRLQEISLEEIRRQNRPPMTPAQMVRRYWGAKGHPSGKKDHFSAALGEALIALGQRVKPENTVQTGSPACQGKKQEAF